MAEIFITGEEVGELSGQAELPVELQYRDHHLVVTGSYRVVVQKQFRLTLAFQKLSGPRLMFEIVDSAPSFGMLDSIIKSSLFHWLQKSAMMPSEAREILSVEYPYITIDITVLPGLDGLFDYLTVEGIDFEESGIRMRFHLLTLPQPVTV